MGYNEYVFFFTDISQEGIFRRTGSLNRQQELRLLLNTGTTLDLDGGPYSVHDCASVLKSFLAELPEPLLTDAHYVAHQQIAGIGSLLSTGLGVFKSIFDIFIFLQNYVVVLLPQMNLDSFDHYNYYCYYYLQKIAYY